jgi:hypothetical protein
VLPFQGKRPQDAAAAAAMQLCAPTQRQQHHLEGMMPQPLQMVTPAAYQACAMPDKAALVDVQGSFVSCVCASRLGASPSFSAAGPSCQVLCCFVPPISLFLSYPLLQYRERVTQRRSVVRRRSRRRSSLPPAPAARRPPEEDGNRVVSVWCTYPFLTT